MIAFKCNYVYSDGNMNQNHGGLVVVVPQLLKSWGTNQKVGDQNILWPVFFVLAQWQFKLHQRQSNILPSLTTLFLVRAKILHNLQESKLWRPCSWTFAKKNSLGQIDPQGSQLSKEGGHSKKLGAIVPLTSAYFHHCTYVWSLCWLNITFGWSCSLASNATLDETGSMITHHCALLCDLRVIRHECFTCPNQFEWL